MKKLFIFLLMIGFSWSLSAKEYDLDKAIKKLFPTAEISKSKARYHYTHQYEILIDQWLDHNDHSKGTFKQRLFLSHFDRKKAMLMVTEGYNARPRHYELTEILNSNQLIVEYRFFGKSTPSNKDWKYLTNQQAMEDYHRINKAFKKIYCKEWISTGISKGGTTCMYYKATYPKDVKVAIPYVAPLPNAREDVRCDELINTVGEESCRTRLFDFQKHALMKQDSMLRFAKEDMLMNDLTFNRVEGVEKALEYAILEYPFSFWQMGHDCKDVPQDASAKATYASIKNFVGIDFYSDGVIALYEPSFYQFMTQNGYYGFMHDHLKGLTKHVTAFDNAIFAPRDVSLAYDSSYNISINQKLAEVGKKMIYIQGEYDPWGALTYKPANGQDAILMVLPGGSHRTRIKNFDVKDQQKIYEKLDKWLKTEIKPLKTGA